MLWEAIRNEPISHWLMLWLSNKIREDRKEIGSTQPRWSKKLGGSVYSLCSFFTHLLFIIKLELVILLLGV